MKEYIAGITVVVSAILFIVGYDYLTRFYSHFGASPSSLEIGLYDVLSHSFVVFREIALLSYLLFSAFVVAALAVLKYAAQLSEFLEPNARLQNLLASSIFRPLGILLLVGLGWKALVYLQNTSLDTAETRAGELLRAAPLLWVSVDLEKEGLLQPASLDSGALHYLFASKGSIVAAIKYPGASDGWIVHIPRAEGLTMRIRYHE